VNQPHPSDRDSALRRGIDAWRAGDVAGARTAVEGLVAGGGGSPQAWLLLALCCGRMGDARAQEEAVDRLLAMEPRSIQGLVLKGDCRARAGKTRSAADFYQRAVDTAAGIPRLPPELAAEVQRARQAVADAHGQFQRSLETVVAAQERELGSLARFSESIDLLLGRKQRYLQQPTGYFFPGLPDSQFYDPGDFPWSTSVEAAAADIRDEYLAAMAAGGELKPFMASSPDHPPQLTGMAGSLDWSAYHLFETGRRVDEHIARCPRTWAAVSQLPIPMLLGVAPSVFFSVLRPGAHIKSHHGVLNTRLVCHLPLSIPPDCGIRVGNDSRTWEEGKLLIFNDAIEHEAWNRSDQARVVLIFEIWRPELAPKERQAVTAMYEAIDSFGAAG
jgi:aspartyl/asparaginyl beta-hydroxylase (cupin superfamily)